MPFNTIEVGSADINSIEPNCSPLMLIVSLAVLVMSLTETVAIIKSSVPVVPAQSISEKVEFAVPLILSTDSSIFAFSFCTQVEVKVTGIGVAIKSPFSSTTSTLRPNVPPALISSIDNSIFPSTKSLLASKKPKRTSLFMTASAESI